MWRATNSLFFEIRLSHFNFLAQLEPILSTWKLSGLAILASQDIPWTQPSHQPYVNQPKSASTVPNAITLSCTEVPLPYLACSGEMGLVIGGIVWLCAVFIRSPGTHWNDRAVLRNYPSSEVVKPNANQALFPLFARLPVGRQNLFSFRAMIIVVPDWGAFMIFFILCVERRYFCHQVFSINGVLNLPSNNFRSRGSKIG